MSKQSLIQANDLMTDERLPSAMTPQAPTIWIDAGAQNSPAFDSYLEFPFRHKRLIVSCVLLSMLAGWLAIVLWPRSYASEAKLKLRVGRENVALDPTVTTSATMTLQKSQQEEIASALQVLGSRRIAEEVVDELGPASILSGVLPGDAPQADATSEGFLSRFTSFTDSVVETAKGGLGSFLTEAGIRSEISEREAAVMQIMSSVNVEAAPDSTIVNVEARAQSPALAQAIVQKLVDGFQDENLDGALTNGSFEFFQREANDAEERLNALVGQRSRYMQEHKIVSVEANRLLLQEQLKGINRDLVEAYGELERAEAQASDLDSKIHRTEDEIVALKAEKEDATWSGMRQKIYELEVEEQLASAKFTENHPQLQRIRSQLQGAREILESRESGRVDLSTTPNPVKVDLGNQLQIQQTTIAGLKSEIEEKEQRQAAMRSQIDELLEQERFLIKLDRDVQVMETNLETLHSKLEEARVLEQLHAEKISNVHLVQPATFVERPVSPNKMLFAGGFLFLGLATGLGLSLLRQSTSTVLRSRDDVESKLGCPAVASIPALPRMASPRPREKRLFREKCQSLLSEILLSQPRSHASCGRSLGIISVDAGSGASTLAMHLALTSSVDCRMKTVLVDADSRQRSISKMFGLNGTPGLVELVSGVASHDECRQHLQDGSIDVVASAADSCTSNITCGAPAIARALQAYLHDCDLLIVDLPAANQPDQAMALARELDSVVVVVESEKTSIASAERLLSRLADSETQVVGVVLNKTKNYLPKVVRSFVSTQD
jgi:uncharacterized protein involved in exopolysaccharide biosynthesis/Mrp family chromosome partitioning ATPase